MMKTLKHFKVFVTVFMVIMLLPVSQIVTYAVECTLGGTVTGDSINYNYSVTLSSADETKGTFIVALYGNERLVGVECVPMTTADASFRKLSSAITTSYAADKYKIMFWDGLDTLKPICDDVNGSVTEPKYIHISFDDVECAFNNLATKKYDSLYDEPFFKWMKGLHDKYGAKFSLYVYDNSLTNVPNTYANEFTAASNWLKIGLHAPNKNNTDYKSSTYEQGKAAWNTFVANVSRITGSYSSVDRMPRLHTFGGSKEALKGMRDATCGALGFLSADDNRNSYYFTNKETTYLYTNDHLTDHNNGLVFVATDLRADWFLSSFSTTNTYRKPTKATVYDELEYRYSNEEYTNSVLSYIMFGHEWQFYNGTSITDSFAKHFEDACKFAYEHKINFDFPQNKAYTSTPCDISPDEEESSNTTLFSGEQLPIITDLKDSVWVGGKSVAGAYTSHKFTDTIGRAAGYFVLNVDGGKTISINQNISSVSLAVSLKEYKNIPLSNDTANQSGQQALTWLTSDTKLHEDTNYVIIAFKRGDGKTNFSKEELELLKSSLSIK